MITFNSVFIIAIKNSVNLVMISIFKEITPLICSKIKSWFFFHRSFYFDKFCCLPIVFQNFKIERTI